MMFCFKQLFKDKEEVASGISFHPPFPLRHLTKPVTVQALSNAMVGLPILKGQPCKSSSLPVGSNNSLAYSYQDCHGRHSFSRFLQFELCLELELVGNFMLTIDDDGTCDECIGFLCNCVLPAELNETKVRQVRSEGKLQPVEKKLRSQSSKFVPSSKPLPPLKSCPPGPAMSSRQRRCIPSSSLIHSSSTSSLSLKL
ncbi:deSI-like protein [Gossypium australe]|uniref:DeSI-like protein n=1 Tax=Gossypium australe TaxID=47621 RepID=A0A5B6W8U9_9ROSI|nr:deSI-like protein [Gossypium australe]